MLRDFPTPERLDKDRIKSYETFLKDENVRIKRRKRRFIFKCICFFFGVICGYIAGVYLLIP